MKKTFKALVAAMVLLIAAPLTAKDFDWSQCWCNYGGGIKQGDLILNVDAGLHFTDLTWVGTYTAYGYQPWFIPAAMVELQYAQPIWKLPFTFGGYAGIHGNGYKYKNSEYHYINIFFGAEAAYHVMLPPKNLDVYASVRMGGAVPLSSDPSTIYFYDYVSGGASIGANWFFTDSFGVNLDLGAPFSKAGITVKF